MRTREIKAIHLLRAHITEILPHCEKELIKREVRFKETMKNETISDDDILIQDLGLDVRTCNTLLRANIHTASQLCSLNNEQLAVIPFVGPKAIRELNFVKSKLLCKIWSKALRE